MSFLTHLQFQSIDRLMDVPLEHSSDDNIDLYASDDDETLEKFWDQVMYDIHKDPEWFTFTNS